MMRRKSCYICPVFTGTCWILQCWRLWWWHESVRSAFRWFIYIYIYIYTYLYLTDHPIQYLFSLSSNTKGNISTAVTSDSDDACARLLPSRKSVLPLNMLFWSGRCVWRWHESVKSASSISVLYVFHTRTLIYLSVTSRPVHVLCRKQPSKAVTMLRWCVSVMSIWPLCVNVNVNVYLTFRIEISSEDDQSVVSVKSTKR